MTQDAETEQRGPRRVGWRVVASLIGGVVVAIVMVVFVVPGAVEHVTTGSIMISLGLGWALMALATRPSDQPQRWAVVPAAYMILVGAALLVFAPSPDTIGVLGWVWPPVILVLSIWMILQARENLRSRTRAWLVYPLCVVFALAAIGGGYTTVREALGPSAIPTAGQLVDVGGHRLYLSCTGSGNPTVVLEAGLWSSSADWDLIAGPVGQDTRVCVYDRASRGHSEPVSGPHDGLAIAADLHALLETANVDGPYVLVGHSSGGAYVKIFAAEYPDEVAGMVLLDAQPVEALTRLPDYPAFYSRTKIAMGLMPTVARMGLFTVAIAHSFRDEFLELPTALEQAAALTSLGDRPLIVVTAVTDASKGWMPLQEEMVALSTNSAHVVLSDATHSSLITDEGDAAMAVQAILEVVDSVRTGSALASS